MKIGDKIRSLRTIKGYSQVNMADLLGISSIAYGDIERNKTDVSHSRLEQIAKAFGIELVTLLSHGEQLANIFSNCSNNHVVGSGDIVYSEKELRHEIEKLEQKNEKLQLEVKYITLEKEKATLEAKYWKEKCSDID